NIFYTNDCWEYDPAANKWTAKKAYPAASIRGAMAFELGGKGYVVGGLAGSGATQQKEPKTFQYDAAADNWAQKKSFPDTARSYGTAFVANGRAYCGLGTSGTNKYPTAFYSYDAATDNWLYAIGGAEFASGRSSAAVAVLNNKIYVGGGTA